MVSQNVGIRLQDYVLTRVWEQGHRYFILLLQFIGELQAYLVIQMVGVKGAQQEINNDERLQKIIQELIV